jgi:hypothetical protein
LALGVLCLAHVAPANAFVYWSDRDGAIGRANNDGSGLNARFTAATLPTGLAVDGSHMYWSSTAGYKVARANLDGSNRTEAFIDAFNRYGVAVDGDHIYWAAASSIGRANLDGSGVNMQFITGVSFACGVALDDTHIYWGSADSNSIGRANLDGSGVNHSFISGDFGPCGVAVNDTHVYWGNWHSDGTTIGRANLNGTGINQDFITGVFRPCALAIHGGRLYWTNENGPIGVADLDGTDANRTFIAGPSSCGVAVDDMIASTTTLSSSRGEIVYGEDVTFTAAVSGAAATPTGTIQFDVDGEEIGAPVALDAMGRATFSAPFLLDRGDVITARYSGNATYAGSRADYAQTIEPARTALGITAEPNPVITGGIVDVLVRVSNLDTDITPYGVVYFQIDGEFLGPPIEIDENGELDVGVIADVPAGNYLVQATYADLASPLFNFYEASGSYVQTVGAATSPPLASPPGSQGTQPPAPAPAVRVNRQQLTTLGSALTRALRARGFKALTSPLTFAAPEPGTLTQRIYASRPRSSARSTARPKALLIASARRIFHSAGEGTLRSRLTAAGRRKTKRAKQLTLRIVTRFATMVGAPVSSTQRVTVQRRGRATASANDGWALMGG